MLERLKRLARKLYNFFRPKKHLRYPKDYSGPDGALTEEANEKRKEILKTELREGDTYQLGPNATVTVGPAGLEGKAWITARVKASEERRKQKFEKWWAEKRERCIEIMLMTPEELIESGVQASVDEFLKENERWARFFYDSGLMRPKGNKREDVPPPVTDTLERFLNVLVQNGMITEEQKKQEMQTAAERASAKKKASEKDVVLVGGKK